MLGDNPPYTDLLIRIGAPRPNTTAPSVEAAIDRDALFERGTLELDEPQLLAAESDNAAYGQILRQALFSDPIQRAYDRAMAKARERTGGQLRIRLQIDDEVARLHAFRWERTSQLFDGQAAPLSTATRTPFSRFTSLEEASAEPLAVSRLRLAVCMSNPGNLPDGFVAVDVEGELRNLQKTIGSLRQNYSLDLVIASGRTPLPSQLRDSLLADGYRLVDGPLTADSLVEQVLAAHVVHFLGHGVFRPDAVSGGGTAALYLEKNTGELDIVRDGDLIPRLRGAARLPHLMVLMACESARRAGVQPFVGLAGKLVQAGIPAIVAMQTKVAMEDASELTHRFYAALLSTGIIDYAANEGRSYLYDSRRSDYSIPALFMRLANGQLLAPDPSRSALQAILAETEPAVQSPPLPIDVVFVTGTPSQPEVDRLSIAGEPPVDMLAATRNVFLERGAPKPAFAVLLGGEGTTKSTHMRRVANLTATQSLQSDEPILPVYANLAAWPAETASLGNGFIEFMAGCLRRFWPGLETAQFRDMLSQSGSPRFLFLIDGIDELSDRQRSDAIRHVTAFADQFPNNQFLVAADACYSDDVLQAAVDLVTGVLIIKPIIQGRAEQYLDSLPDPAAKALKQALDDHKLYDLASRPWLLARMLAQARRGTRPSSRAAVLKQVVDESLAKVTSDRGMRARAGQALYALAWHMHWHRNSSLPLDQAFPVIESARGSRGFVAEELFQQLVEQNLLAQVGQDRMRFAYSAIQSYGCAQWLACMPADQRKSMLDDITAALGRLTRLRWWDEALVILSGLLPTDDRNDLIGLILYGSGFAEGERAFLAARCIQESGVSGVNADVLDQVGDALVWRTRIANEPRTSTRIRAIEALAGIQATGAMAQLASLAVDQVRKNYIGKDDYERSSVRLAATLALMRMDSRSFLEKERPAFARTLDLWRSGDVEALGKLLAAAAPPAAAQAAAGESASGTTSAPSPDAVSSAPPPPDFLPSIATFALGQLHTPRAAELLVAGYLNSDLPAETRWCITDTMRLLDPQMVNEKVLLAFFGDASPDVPPEVLKTRQYRYDQLAYLAGKIKSREPTVLKFLDNCISVWRRVSLKGRAIQAIGGIYTPDDGEPFDKYKKCFEQIAAGVLESVPLAQPVQPDDLRYLQFCALEALCQMGDSFTLSYLRNYRQNWPTEVERQFFLTSEEIYWRAANNR